MIVIIPARFASTRYPGKPLVHLKGCTGASKSLIERSWLAATSVHGVDRVVIATDDDRIAHESKGFGAEVVMTSEDCDNGTERCSDALARLQASFDIVVNLQGDAPLTPYWFVENLVSYLRANPQAQVATPVLRCDRRTLANLQEDRRNHRVGATTAVFDANNRAHYFSKEVIPHVGRDPGKDEVVPVFHHVGVYAYRPEALTSYGDWPVGALEKWEGLEQLRFLENGCAVHCVEVDGKGRAFWELNNPEDVPKIEQIFRDLNVE